MMSGSSAQPIMACRQTCCVDSVKSYVSGTRGGNAEPSHEPESACIRSMSRREKRASSKAAMGAKGTLESGFDVQFQNAARVASNEANDVNTEAQGSGSVMKGSDCFLDLQLFLGYRPVGLSRNPACRILMLGRISANCLRNA